MNIEMLKSKINKAIVTGSDISYEGSITLSEEIMRAANLREYEKVDVNNLTNGRRISTYVLKSEDPGKVQINGAAALLFFVGDEVHVLSYASVHEHDLVKVGHLPTIVDLDENNEVIE